MVRLLYLVVVVVAVAAWASIDSSHEEAQAATFNAAFGDSEEPKPSGARTARGDEPLRPSDGRAPMAAGQGETLGGATAELWRDARLAAWRGELERSATLYRELGRREPGSADAAGELGNVLMRMGDWHAAADAYSDAALRSYASGQVEGAWYLQRVVAGLDPSRAASLYQQLIEASRERKPEKER